MWSKGGAVAVLPDTTSEVSTAQRRRKISRANSAAVGDTRKGGQDPWWVRLSLISGALLIVAVLIVVPVVHVFSQSLAEGPRVYWKNLFGDPDTRHAIFLTLTV